MTLILLITFLTFLVVIISILIEGLSYHALTMVLILEWYFHFIEFVFLIDLALQVEIIDEYRW